LDYKRLCKQRLEAKQLIQVTEKVEATPGLKVAWMNHPARLMWVGYLDALKVYYDLAVTEWVMRGYKNTMKLTGLSLLSSPIKYPLWIGDKDFHASHRSNLFRKDPIFYGRYSWSEPNDLPYIWPTTNYVSQ
jgi:hypothetical protein